MQMWAFRPMLKCALLRDETANDMVVCVYSGFTPALRSGCTAFKGAAVSAQTTSRISGPVMADAWVRVGMEALACIFSHKFLIYHL